LGVGKKEEDRAKHCFEVVDDAHVV